MDYAHVSSAGSSLYMKFRKPLTSAQGIASWGDRAFILYDVGVCAVYDLKSRSSRPLDVFPLGSFNWGKPCHDFKNHANSCEFSRQHWEGNPIPLLYVDAGAGIGSDKDGYFYRIKVENITSTVDEAGNESYRGKVLQTVVVRPEGDPERGFRDPGWGCPCHVLDAEGGFIYTVSARYRTTRGSLPEGKTNALIITKYPVPEVVEGSTVRLAGKDILDQWVLEDDTLFTQSGIFYQGKIYYFFGCAVYDYPNHVMVIDLQNRRIEKRLDDDLGIFGLDEFECGTIYNGMLLVNANEVGAPDGNLYMIREDLLR